MRLVESVRHDAAALCQFIDQVTARCILAESPSYTAPAKEFFAYILDLARASQEHLQSFVTSLDEHAAQTDPDAFCTDAQQIQTIRYSWFKLHRFVKPALDADTLEFPHAYVEFLSKRLNEIPGFKDSRFAVLHTSDLNYYQVNTGHVEQLAADIAAVVPSSPAFPKGLGLTIIPYSQSSSLFLNSAVAHEMGHHAFDKSFERDVLRPLVVKSLIQMSTFSTLTSTDPLRAQLCIDRCLGWLTEVYCDLFATSLIGPSFAFGFTELFAYSRFSRLPIRGSAPTPIASFLDFSWSHPSDALRLREQVTFMKRATVGWWSEISKSSNANIDLLLEAAKVLDSDFTLDHDINDEPSRLSLHAFLDVLPSVHISVERIFQGVNNGVAAFIADKKSIQTYLNCGVVPSRLIDNGKATIPSGLSILNAAHLFYLDELDNLLVKIEAAEVNCLACRALWSQKIEMWATKALEDVGG